MFKIRVLTPNYWLAGEVEENNAFLGWLNNKDKKVLELHNVKGITLDPASVLPALVHNTITLHKNQIVAIDLSSPEAQRNVKIGSRAEPALLYSDRFVIEGNLHPSGEMPISRIPDVVQSNFVPLSEVKLNPLIPTNRKLSVIKSKLMIFSWQYIDFYHGR